MTLLRGVAKISASGAVKQLDGKAQPDQIVTESDVQQPRKLARLLSDLLKDIAALKRRAYPRRIDFEDIVVDATGVTAIPMRHGFNGRVRWWPVDWRAVGTSGPQLNRGSATDANTLVLVSYAAGTVTIRVEEAG